MQESQKRIVKCSKIEYLIYRDQRTRHTIAGIIYAERGRYGSQTRKAHNRQRRRSGGTVRRQQPIHGEQTFIIQPSFQGEQTFIIQPSGLGRAYT